MSLLSYYITQVQQLVHDSAGIDYQTSELTLYINEARQRCALDFACVRTFFDNLSAIVNQETYPMYGGVAGAKVTVGGSYSTPPTVTFSAPPAPGITATGNAVLANGPLPQPVAQVAMTIWGSGYTTTPTVTFSAGAPTAVATAQALVNVFDINTISFLYPPGGTGLIRTTLNWAPFSKFNAFYRTNTIISKGNPGVWTTIFEQNLIYLFRIPDQNYVQADYYDKKYEKRALQMGLTRYAPRRPNIYQTNWRRLQRGF